MMTSQRPRDVGGSFSNRRGHANQLSISDPTHHITETIGTMYGDDDDYPNNDLRPMSFIAAPGGGEQITPRREVNPSSPEERRLPLIRTTSDNTGLQISSGPTTNGNSVQKSQPLPGRMPSQRSTTSRSSSYESGPKSPITPMSPTLRDMREDAQQYPITNIDNPNDIAQELSNLQALRRMSMDVSNNSDPDLLPFQGMSLMAMPSIAPKGDDDADPSRLLWVPANVHPELAPTEFKNFVEKRVQTMKRRSADSSLSVDGLDRSNSSGLRRKKSMLSRQIDNAGGHGAESYMDGAERLERNRSQRQSGQGPSELSLDDLVNDPSKVVQKLALDSQRQDGGGEVPNVDDMPILPVAPGMGLRRSTRTTYRKGGSLKNRQSGSLRSDDRLPFSKRIAAKKAEEDSGAMPNSESTIEAPPGHGLTRVQSEPISDSFSRPSKPMRRQQTFSRDTTPDLYEDPEQDFQESGQAVSAIPEDPTRTPSADAIGTLGSTPQILEQPVAEEDHSGAQTMEINRPFPERSSSQRNAVQPLSPGAPAEPPARSTKRPNYGQPLQSSSQPQAAGQPSQQTRTPSGSNRPLNDMSQSPSPFPGSSATSTESLTFIPTFNTPEERKPEKKGKKDKGESESEKSKSTSWKWFKSDDKEKKKKDDENRKSKTKALVEKAHDNVRLDVLQTSIDTAIHKGRESLLLDRESVDGRLEEEKKDSRKSTDQKKEKDGLFASFFGSKPTPYRPQRPDVDYHWTRFPLLEERAIYRMAHIKLANPRRALYSQVLLSNFMYSYLAKVQAMHPQIQVPQSPQQKRLQEEERRRREQEQQYLEQQQAQESMDQYNFEYHRSSNQQQQYGDPGMQHEAGDYPEAAEIYDYEHNSKDQTSRENQGDYNGQDGDKDYYSTYVQYHHNENGRRQQQQSGEEEMW
ncbi:Protein zds1 [Daldinia childiae]|uniref:Protein zds1 n=1 Tax=Daldinia childiae TaxID=326645 RepID=UPI0014485AC3|nr:Protein zds1 [Daldinia childiae]KAF3061683.1 Protein zds1 [Daldinia childiae]